MLDIGGGNGCGGVGVGGSTAGGVICEQLMGGWGVPETPAKAARACAIVAAVCDCAHDISNEFRIDEFIPVPTGELVIKIGRGKPVCVHSMLFVLKVPTTVTKALRFAHGTFMIRSELDALFCSSKVFWTFACILCKPSFCAS